MSASQSHDKDRGSFLRSYFKTVNPDEDDKVEQMLQEQKPSKLAERLFKAYGKPSSIAKPSSAGPVSVPLVPFAIVEDAGDSHQLAMCKRVFHRRRNETEEHIAVLNKDAEELARPLRGLENSRYADKSVIVKRYSKPVESLSGSRKEVLQQAEGSIWQRMGMTIGPVFETPFIGQFRIPVPNLNGQTFSTLADNGEARAKMASLFDRWVVWDFGQGSDGGWIKVSFSEGEKGFNPQYRCVSESLKKHWLLLLEWATEAQENPEAVVPLGAWLDVQKFVYAMNYQDVRCKEIVSKYIKVMKL